MRQQRRAQGKGSVAAVLLPEPGSRAMMEITIRVPDALGHRLERYLDRLPELLERGLREVALEGTQQFEDETEILALLASRPAPEEILALRPSAALQARLSTLLDREQQQALTPEEQAELERFLLLEHLVRLAKAQAYKERATG
jgi:hypothetical protein